MSNQQALTVSLLLFPQLTQLDLNGPWEAFSGLPDVTTCLVWKDRHSVSAAKGIQILSDTTFADCPQLEVLCIPGGPGLNAKFTDAETLRFVRCRALGALLHRGVHRFAGTRRRRCAACH